MSLFKRGNVWWSYFFVDGIRHQYSTGTPNRKQAEAVENKLKEEVNNRRFDIVGSNPDMTFGNLAARFLASGIARPHHIYHLKILLSFFSEVPVLRITKPMAEEFRRVRQSASPTHPCKDATVNRDLSVLRHLLYWAVDERLLATNPLARLKMARERRTRRPLLSVAEEESLLAASPEHLRAMIIAALDTGMRRGEITSQQWEDIDFAHSLLFVTRSKTPEGESREIPLTERLSSLLDRNRRTAGIVFGYQGGPVRIVKRSWKTALKKAAIRPLRFHDLRHTFNTRLMECGVMQEVRMALMGHSPGHRVHAAYTHIELPVKREAIRKLEEWVRLQKSNNGGNCEKSSENSQAPHAGDPDRLPVGS